MASSSSTPSAPTSLTDLTIADQIGKGASAVVKLATSSAGVPYALKVIAKKNIVGQAQLTRLYREKDLLASLSHPSIVTFHATLKDDEHLYFLLELLPGGDLWWHMCRDKRRRVMGEDARIVLSSLLPPLRYMQDQSILFRDLKPTNILFTATGKLKLVDFGHAKRIEGHSLDEERSTSVCGTPHYNAPETVKGEGHGLPAQLWAFGVLLTEMHCGKAPFWELPSSPIKEQILAADPDLTPMRHDEAATSLASALLTADPVARSANFGSKGYAGVMEHEYFKTVDWAALEAGNGPTPGFDFALHASDVLGEKDEPKADEVDGLSKVFADF